MALLSWPWHPVPGGWFFWVRLSLRFRAALSLPSCTTQPSTSYSRCQIPHKIDEALFSDWLCFSSQHQQPLKTTEAPKTSATSRPTHSKSPAHAVVSNGTAYVLLMSLEGRSAASWQQSATSMAGRRPTTATAAPTSRTSRRTIYRAVSASLVRWEMLGSMLQALAAYTRSTAARRDILLRCRRQCQRRRLALADRRRHQLEVAQPDLRARRIQNRTTLPQNPRVFP
jgi:hypothetical protein